VIAEEKGGPAPMTADLTAVSDDRTALAGPAPAAMTFDRMLEKVRYNGAYPTREHAETVVRGVLAALGRQLSREDRAELAACLPGPAARALTDGPPAASPTLTGRGFVADLAERTGTGNAVARWDAGSVLTTVASLAGPQLLSRMLARLPAGYALLFGRPELVQPASVPATRHAGTSARRAPGGLRTGSEAARLPRLPAPAVPPVASAMAGTGVGAGAVGA
jgi:uncharacterized protein (DUF2267 family)